MGLYRRSLPAYVVLIGTLTTSAAVAETTDSTPAPAVQADAPAMAEPSVPHSALTAEDRQRLFDQHLKAVYDLRREQKYEQALKAVDQAILIAPDHEGAKLIREMLVEAEMVVGVKNLYHQQYLLVVGHRRDPIAPVVYIETLDRTTRITLDWRDMSLTDAAAALGKTMQVRVDIDWPRFKDTLVNRDTVISVTFENVKPTLVMDALVRHLRVLAPRETAVWVIRDGAFVLTTAADPGIEPINREVAGESWFQWRMK